MSLCMDPKSPSIFVILPEGRGVDLDKSKTWFHILWMEEIHFAPPKKPWSDDSPVNTKKKWLQSGAGFRPSEVGH